MGDLVIYTLTGCPYCQKVMEGYRKQGISFQEICLTGDPELRKKVKEEYAADRVPVVVREGKLVQVGDETGGG
ncbi:MAG: glutaredoxin family protein [Bacillota bacterium]|nr:glutaredoxin family protein [Bacillota bacterium]